ncbi:hypothetical protein LOK49_LG11G02223 [Camellia lanceoleosa]|uniref:Uncharacterized protein n=1 Tax=Camellia lanceoleosa TaxID=1840588 RepID=A0ACC0FZS0_9ERIC|nr:hypothetical protein LOK49_LG11G02223 [Camellia lanceoleosa]
MMNNILHISFFEKMFLCNYMGAHDLKFLFSHLFKSNKFLFSTSSETIGSFISYDKSEIRESINMNIDYI